MSDMRYTTLVVTVGDYDGGETQAEIRDQVLRGVRLCGFMTVDVRLADVTCRDCGEVLVTAVVGESEEWRTRDGGKYFCRVAADTLHRAAVAGA